MSEIPEKVYEKVPWPLVIVLSAFLGAFGVAWTAFLPANLFSFYNLGTILCVMNLTAAPFFIIIFAALFTRLMRRKISLVTLTYLYVVGVTSSCFIEIYPMIEWGDIIASRHMNQDWSVKYVPWFMAPPPEITSHLISGYMAIPWGEWLLSTLYHWSFYLLFGLFFISVATLFRRQWIDVDQVPFPHTLVTYELVRRIPEEKKSLMEKLGRPFLIGIILGFAFQIPVFMTSVFPWFPDVYGWKNLCWSGQSYVRAESPLAGIVGLSAFQEHPAAVAIGYLVPLSISFNAWFWHLVYIILMQVAFAMGYYTGIESKGGCGRAWCVPSGLLEEPFKFEAISCGGGLLGLAVIGLLLNRGYIGETLRAAFQKRSSTLEIEKNEALTYRNTYMLLASSFILLIIFFVLVGMGLGALLLVITYFLYWIANVRIFGLAGLRPQGLGPGQTLYRLLMWPQAPDPPTREYVLSAYYSSRGIDSIGAAGGSIITSISSYKMASITGASNHSVLKVMIASTVIAPVVSIMTVIWLCYAYGSTVFANISGEIQLRQFFNISDPMDYNKAAGTEPLAPYAIAGFIIVATLEFLHSRFVWFPFNAIGFIIGTSKISVLWGYWFTFLIAWILKTITLRVGGSKLYENLGVPIACGFITGYMIAVIFGGATGVLRFFFPY